MQIVFMGTSSFAVPALIKLIENQYEIVAVVTQPDRPQGRGKKVMFPPVKETAVHHCASAHILQFERIKDEQSVKTIADLVPDLIVVISYGQIIPKQILDLPRFGCINVHASLLPNYRGAAPIQRALRDGEQITGVTTMLMDTGLDTGAVLMQRSLPVDSQINHGKLEQVLSQMGADLLIETIEGVRESRIVPIPQTDALATYAHMLTREDEKIDWNQSAQDVHNQVRSLSPAPGAYTGLNGLTIKVFQTQVIDESKQGIPGQLLNVTREGLVIQTGKGWVEILEAQKPGKKRMKAKELWQGMRLQTGIILSS